MPAEAERLGLRHAEIHASAAVACPVDLGVLAVVGREGHAEHGEIAVSLAPRHDLDLFVDEVAVERPIGDFPHNPLRLALRHDPVARPVVRGRRGDPRRPRVAKAGARGHLRCPGGWGPRTPHAGCAPGDDEHEHAPYEPLTLPRMAHAYRLIAPDVGVNRCGGRMWLLAIVTDARRIAPYLRADGGCLTMRARRHSRAAPTRAGCASQRRTKDGGTIRTTPAPRREASAAADARASVGGRARSPGAASPPNAGAQAPAAPASD